MASRVHQLVERRSCPAAAPPRRRGSASTRLDHPAHQPRPGAGRGVRLGGDHLPDRLDQPGVGAAGRFPSVATARWSTRPHSPCASVAGAPALRSCGRLTPSSAALARSRSRASWWPGRTPAAVSRRPARPAAARSRPRRRAVPTARAPRAPRSATPSSSPNGSTAGSGLAVDDREPGRRHQISRQHELLGARARRAAGPTCRPAPTTWWSLAVEAAPGRPGAAPRRSAPSAVTASVTTVSGCSGIDRSAVELVAPQQVEQHRQHRDRVADRLGAGHQRRRRRRTPARSAAGDRARS